MIMSGPQRISGEAFAIERLRDNPDLDYSTLRREAESAGVSMQPIQYGRARKQLGLPPLSTRSEPRLGNSTPFPLPFGRDDSPIAPKPALAAEVVTNDDEAEGDAGDDDGVDAKEAAAADMVAPKRKGSPAFEFLVQELRAQPAMLYAELKNRAAAKGYSIAPIMYGRAKAVLGLVPVRPRGQGGKRARNASAPAPVAEAPRVLRQVESVAAERFSKQLEDVRNLEQLVSVVKDLDADRRRLRDLLQRIVTMIDEAIG